MSGLKVNAVTKTFKQKTILQPITFSVQAGEFVSIVGPSGCGKSTLLNMIASIETVDEGTIDYNGDSPKGKVSYMPQQDLLLPWRTALENITLPLELEHVPKKQRLAQGMDVLRQFGLAEYANHYPTALSGGMRQRISFLRAYLCNKPLMLLDEPFGKLDAFTKMEVHRWLLDTWEKGKQTIVMVTHDLDEAILLSDRVIILSQQPASIIGDVSIQLARPRTIDMLTSAEVKNYKENILSVLEPYMYKHV
ncbi:ABC transporter ATP-binding protein [Microbacteriaceae bacterium 4G12]